MYDKIHYKKKKKIWKEKIKKRKNGTLAGRPAENK